jgi:hypothetical protein
MEAQMAKNTIVDVVADAVLQAEIASVKATRQVVGAVQRKVANVGKAVSQKSTAKKSVRKITKGARAAVSKTKRSVRKAANKAVKRARRE